MPTKLITLTTSLALAAASFGLPALAAAEAAATDIGTLDRESAEQALARLNHVIPLPPLRVGKQLRVTTEQKWEKAEPIRVIGHHEEVERPGKFDLLAAPTRQSRSL